MYLFIDTETTGLPADYKKPVTDSANWPRLVQLAFLLYDKGANLISSSNFIIKPVGYEIPSEASKVHGITTEAANKAGHYIDYVFKCLFDKMVMAKTIVGHNVSFDLSIIEAELYRMCGPTSGYDRYCTMLRNRNKVCTMRAGEGFCKLPGKFEGKYKWPKLAELHQKLFGDDFAEAHNAAADIKATAKCFFEMVRLGIIK